MAPEVRTGERVGGGGIEECHSTWVFDAQTQTLV